MNKLFKTCLFFLVVLNLKVFAVSATWSSTATGPSIPWKDEVNWTPNIFPPPPPGYPDGSVDTAIFNDLPPAVSRDIAITGPAISLATMEFKNAAYTLRSGTIRLFKSINATDNGEVAIISDLVIVNDVDMGGIAGEIIIEGVMSGPGNITQSAGLVSFGGINPNTFTGTIIINGGEFNSQQDPGTIGISGNVVINNSGTLSVNRADQFGSNSEVTCNSGGTLNLGLVDQTMSSFTFNGGSIIDHTTNTLTLAAANGFHLNLGNGVTISGPVSLTGASSSGVAFTGTISGAFINTLNLGNNTRTIFAGGVSDPGITVTGPISQTGNAGLTKIGPGAVNLQGANLYTGPTTISEGILRLDGSAATLNAASAVVIGSEGTFEITTGPFTKTIGTLSGTGGEILLNNNFLSITDTSNATCSSAISGSGGIIKTGTETLTLDGINSYSGGTLISGGTLQGTTLALQGPIENNAALIFNQSGDGAYDSSIFGTGSLAKLGIGTVNLTGPNVIPGGTTINAGALLIQANFQSDITVNSSGILGGTGVITGSVVAASGGIVAPGSSLGILSIIGPYTQSSGSIFRTEINDRGNSDRLNVTGLVTIQSNTTIELDPLPGIYFAGEQYTVINSSMNVIGTFDVVSTPSFFAASAATDGTIVEVTLTQSAFVELGLLTTGNAQQVAICLSDRPILPGSELAQLAIALKPLSANSSKFQDALDQLQPAIYGAANLVQASQLTLLQSTFVHRLQAWGNGECGALAPYTWNVWVKPVGEFINQQSRGENVGYKAQAYGFMLGADRKFFEHLHFGIAGGYIYNDIDWKRSRGELDSRNFYAGGYLFWQEKAFHVLASIAGGYNDYDGFRRMKFTTFNQRADRSGDGYVVGGHLEVAYTIRKGHFVIEPYGKTEYIYSSQAPFKEYGAGILNLNVDRKSSDRFCTNFGLDFSYCVIRKCNQFIPNFYLGWAWEKQFKGDKMKATFPFFNCTMHLKTYRPTRSLFVPGIGLTGIFCDQRLSIAAKWDGEFKRHYSNQKILLEATYGF